MATEAAKVVMEYGFDTFQFDRLVAVVNHANRRSIPVAGKLGMTFERRFIHKGAEVARLTHRFRDVNAQDVVCYSRNKVGVRGDGHRGSL